MSGEGYATPQPHSRSRPTVIEVAVLGHALSFWVDRGVFSSQHLDPGTEILLAALPPVAGRAVLDMGAGWGAIGLSLSRLGRAGRVVLIDVNERAVTLVRETARQWGISADVRLADGYQGLAEDERFDLIVTNPPVRSGKGTYYPWVEQASAHLAKGGSFWAVIRTKQGAASLARHMQQHLDRCRRVARQSGYEVWVGDRREAP